MKNHVVIPIAWLAAAVLIVGFALGMSIRTAQPAQATGAEYYAQHHAADICEHLDADPSIGGLIWTMQAVQDASGMDDHDSAWSVVLSIRNVCRIHQPIVNQFVAAYAGDTNQ